MIYTTYYLNEGTETCMLQNQSHSLVICC